MPRATSPGLTKPGRFGPLYLYRIAYRDKDDPSCPVFRWNAWAYSAEHAEDKFFEGDDDGWTIVSTVRVSR